MRTQILSTLLGAALVVSVPAWADDEKDKNSSTSSSSAQSGTGSQTGAYGRTSSDRDATHGTVKEYKAGDQITINVPNGLDKKYDLNDSNTRVTVAAGVKEGDAVSVTETEQGGMKVVQIARHSGSSSGMAGSSSGTAGSASSQTSSSSSPSATSSTSPSTSSSASGTYGTQPGTRSQSSQTSSSSSQSASGTYGQSGSGSSAMAGGQVTFGKVKEMKAGEEITIDISNGDDKTFDLKQPELVTVAAGLKQGDSVKVTEWDQSGKKMVRIESQDSATAGTSSSDSSSPRTDEPDKKDKPKNP